MCTKRFKEKRKVKNYDKHVECIKESNVTVRTNFAKAKTLVAMATTDEMKAKLQEIVDLLEYQSPSTVSDIVKQDGKISDKLDDVKILVAGNKEESKILDKVNDIRIMIVDRNNMAGV